MLRDSFYGVWPSDQLPLLKRGFKLPAYFIVNTDPSDQPGEHWLALTLEKGGEATFFDSFGISPDSGFYPQSILKFLNKYSQNIKYHVGQLQDHSSKVCGHHCVYYLYHRARGLSFKQVLELYSRDTIKNDLEVYNFVKKYQRCIKTPVTQGNCCFQLFKKCCHA